MQKSLINIIRNYSLEDLNSVKLILEQIHSERLKDLESSPNLKRFSSEYSEYVKNNFSNSYERSVRLSFEHLQKYFGKTKLMVEIRPFDAEKFKTYLQVGAPKGYAVYIRSIKAAFNKAKEWKIIDHNPFIGVKISKQQQIKPHFLNDQQFRKVIKATINERIKEIFIFGFYTGCRLGEILQIRWGNIDLAKAVVTIGGENFVTKNKHTRQIPLHQEVLEILKSRKTTNENRLLFSKPNGYYYNRDYVSRQFKLSRRRAELGEEIHFHSLRHSFATNLALKGIPLVTIKELLGHSSILSTQIYSHSDLDSKRSAIEIL